MALSIPASDEKRVNFIGGRFMPPQAGQYEPCRNPADTRDVLGLYPRSGVADARAAVDAACAAFPSWAAPPGPERGRVLLRAHRSLSEQIDLLAEALCREEGKTLSEARGEVQKGLNLIEFYGGQGFRMQGRTLPSEPPRTPQARLAHAQPDALHGAGSARGGAAARSAQRGHRPGRRDRRCAGGRP